MDSPIEFTGYNIQPQFLRSDKSFRITIDISKDQIERVKDVILQKLPDGLYKITIRPEVIEE